MQDEHEHEHDNIHEHEPLHFDVEYRMSVIDRSETIAVD